MSGLEDVCEQVRQTIAAAAEQERVGHADGPAWWDWMGALHDALSEGLDAARTIETDRELELEDQLVARGVPRQEAVRQVIEMFDAKIKRGATQNRLPSDCPGHDTAN